MISPPLTLFLKEGDESISYPFFTFSLLYIFKNHFFNLHINFYNYKILHVPLSILQYLLLKYYKIFIFYNIFSRNPWPPNPETWSYILSSPYLWSSLMAQWWVHSEDLKNWSWCWSVCGLGIMGFGCWCWLSCRSDLS